jgi:hypothetical protein
LARYHAKRGRIYMSPDLSTAASPMVSMAEWTLDMSTDSVDVTSYEDTNKVYVRGYRDTKGNLNGNWDDTSDALFIAAESPGAVNLYLYPSLDAVTHYWYGPGFVSASLNAANTGAVKITGTFVAAGSWGRAG